MTKMNYQFSKIYKLVSKKTGKIFIGSTTKKYLSSRKSQHLYEYRMFPVKRDKSKSFHVLKDEDIDIILIEKYPCNDKDELHSRTMYWIDYIDCVNKEQV